jgi:hypothetical protein
MPYQTNFAALSPRSAPSQDDFGRFQHPIEESKQTMMRPAPSLETDLQATAKLHNAESPPTSAAYPLNEFQETSIPFSSAEAQAAQVSCFPDVLSFTTPEEEVEPHEDEIIPEKQWTLKRTYLESQTLDSLVTSIDLAYQAPSKRKHPDFSDKSYGALFGTTTDPTTGCPTTAQQVFPKRHWPTGLGKGGIHDHILTSMTNCTVHIVSIAMQAAFNIQTEAEEIFGTVLSSSKDAVEVRINDQSNLINQMDSFKIPSFSQATVINQSTRTQARLQMFGCNTGRPSAIL